MTTPRLTQSVFKLHSNPVHFSKHNHEPCHVALESKLSRSFPLRNVNEQLEIISYIPTLHWQIHLPETNTRSHNTIYLFSYSLTLF